MALLSCVSAPTEGVICRQEKTTACVGNSDLGQGCVFVAESCVTWLSDNGQGFTLNYPDISLHAISKDQNAFPKPCLYVMFDGKLDQESGDKESEEEEEERDPMPEVTEIRFVPDDANSLESLYSAMCECQALHPDENDSASGDDDDEYDGGYDDPVIVTASGDHHHGDAFGGVDDGFTGEHEPQVGIVHSNGDATAMDVNEVDEDQFEDVADE